MAILGYNGDNMDLYLRHDNELMSTTKPHSINEVNPVMNDSRQIVFTTLNSATNQEIVFSI